MVKYRATITCRIPYTDDYQEVYRSVLWDTYEEAEDDACENRGHYKERIHIEEVNTVE